jgi:DNA-binding response OmpR family regulator
LYYQIANECRVHSIYRMSKVIIVEDDTFLQSLASQKLGKEGFTVVAISDGNVAYDTVKKEKPDIMLLDLMMPGVDGFQVLEKVKSDESTKAIPVVVFSNLSDDKDINRAKELGAVEFMVKSNFTLDELVEKVKSILK